jgi:hypothetical protein
MNHEMLAKGYSELLKRIEQLEQGQPKKEAAAPATFQWTGSKAANKSAG